MAVATMPPETTEKTIETRPGTHLNAMDQFKELCTKNGFSTFTRAENTDDETIRRFLHAQRYDISAAFSQFYEYQIWNRKHNIRGFYEGVDIEIYEETRKMYPQWIGRRDTQGRPVYVFQVRKLTKKKLDSYLNMLDKAPRPATHAKSDERIHILHLHALYENLLQFSLPLVSELPRPDMKSAISASTHIVDISNVSVFQFWNIRKYLQEASRIATAHYPETLGRVFVVGAPAFFQSVWNAISQWFDPETRSKISILSSSEEKAFLLSHINSEDLPKEYGGELDWKWQDQPNLDISTRRLIDDVYQKTDRGEVYSKGPLVFQNWCIRLVGSVEGTPRRNSFCRLGSSSGQQ